VNGRGRIVLKPSVENMAVAEVMCLEKGWNVRMKEGGSLLATPAAIQGTDPLATSYTQHLSGTETVRFEKISVENKQGRSVAPVDQTENERRP
jgi:hypothetical protein